MDLCTSSVRQAEVVMNDDSDLSDIDPDYEEASSDDDCDNNETLSTGSSQWGPVRRKPSKDIFLGQRGPTKAVEVENEDSPIDYFSLIFTDDLYQTIVEETNRYAAQFARSQPLSPSSKGWKDIGKDELKKYLGLTMLSGVIDKKGKFVTYWSTDRMLSTPFFGECMSRNRYQQITKFLHFNDNENLPDSTDDRLYKIRPIYGALVQRWRALYNLGEHIAIDEAMMKWRGRLLFKVYMKNKPTRYGIKSYVLADSSSNYCWNLDMYHGVGKSLKTIVLDLLTDKCHYKWHTLYMDNFYNSVGLSEHLLSLNMHTVGTLRTNRCEPSEIKFLTKMARGDVIARDNGKVVVLAWKQKRIVRAITTKHDATMSPTSQQQKNAGGEMEMVKKPNCILDYNEHMSGVDQMDQMISYYPCTRKTQKWTKKTFLYLMGISVHNAFILYKEKSKTKSHNSLYKFYVELIRQMCQRSKEIRDSTTDGGPPCKSPRKDPPQRLQYGFKLHRLAKFPPTENSAKAQRQCRVCSKKKSRKSTRYYCTSCGVPLCLIPCFHNYHIEVNY